MPDRVGQVWEFNDGMIFLVVSSCEDEERGVYSHDVFILHEGTDNHEEFSTGMLSNDWSERRGDGMAWERPANHDERWRL